MKKTYSNPSIMIETVFSEDILTESVGRGLQNDAIFDYNSFFNNL